MGQRLQKGKSSKLGVRKPTSLACRARGGRRLAGPAWQQEQNRAESQVWVVEGTEHADGLLIASEKNEMMTPGFLTEYKDEWMAHLLS